MKEKKEKVEKRIIYVIGDWGDADYVSVKVSLTEKTLENAFEYFLNEVKKHKGIIEKMEVFNVESDDFYDEEVSEFIPFARDEFVHRIEFVQDISPNKPHKVLFKHPDFYGD